MKSVIALLALMFVGCGSTVLVEKEVSCGAALFDDSSDPLVLCDSSAKMYQDVWSCACFDDPRVVNPCDSFCSGESTPSDSCIHALHDRCINVMVVCLLDQC